MNELIFQNMLQEVLMDSDEDFDVATFDERGFLTNNKGLEITLPSGEVFQLTIVEG